MALSPNRATDTAPHVSTGIQALTSNSGAACRFDEEVCRRSRPRDYGQRQLTVAVAAAAGGGTLSSLEPVAWPRAPASASGSRRSQ